MNYFPTLVVLGILILLFFLCRAIVLWYWKVDRIVALLESIDKRLQPEAEKIEDQKKRKALSEQPGAYDTGI